MRICVLICVRNEELHIDRCLSDWIAGGCDVVLIDNDSTDRTVEKARKYLGRGLLSIERLPWRGVVSLREQLALKMALIAGLDHDWVIHADADEWHVTPWPGVSIHDGLIRAEADGFTCVNMHEIVFVPWPHENFERNAKNMTTYYYSFDPAPNLMRAWRRDIGATNVEFAGHRLDRGRLSPVNFFLRHYIVLSLEHAAAKYLGRRFDPDELASGWHVRRACITKENLPLRPSPYLKTLDNWSSVDFDLSAPSPHHFWEW